MNENSRYTEEFVLRVTRNKNTFSASIDGLRGTTTYGNNATKVFAEDVEDRVKIFLNKYVEKQPQAEREPAE